MLFALCQEIVKKNYNFEKYAPAPEGTQHVVFLLGRGEELFGKKIDIGCEA